MPSALPVWYIEAGSVDDAGKFKRVSMGSAVIVGIRKAGESGLKRMLLTAQHVLRSGDDQRHGTYHPEIRAWPPQTGFNPEDFTPVSLFTGLAPDDSTPLIDAEDLAFLELPATHGSLVCNLLSDADCQVGLEKIRIGGYPQGQLYLKVREWFIDPSEHPDWRYTSANSTLGMGILAPGDAPPREGVSGGGVFHQGLYAGIYRGEINKLGEHLFLPIQWIRQWCGSHGYELYSSTVRPDATTGSYYAEAMDAIREGYPGLADLGELASLLKQPLPDNPVYDRALFKLIEDLAAGPGYSQAIQLAATLRPDSPKIAALARKLLPPAPPAPLELPIYDYAVFGQSSVMVNRQNLRRAVRDIDSFGSQRVLIVKGSPLSGRSYSRNLIKHIASRQDAPMHLFRLKDIILPRTSDASAGVATTDQSPWEIARLLVDDLRGSGDAAPPVQQTETEARWTMTLLPKWTASQLRTVPGKRWIVFEGFDQELISEHVYNYLCWTAAEIENVLPGIRIAFLGYDRPVPSILADAARIDETATLERADFSTFFKNLAKQCQQRPDPALLENSATFCWDEYVSDLDEDAARPAPAPGEPPFRNNALSKLNKRLQKAITVFQ